MAAVGVWFTQEFLLGRGEIHVQIHAVQSLSEIFSLLCKCLHACLNCCFSGWDAFLPISSFCSAWLVSQKVREVSHWIVDSWSLSGKRRLRWKAMPVNMSAFRSCTHMVTLSSVLSKPGSCVYLPTSLSLQRGHTSRQAHSNLMLHASYEQVRCYKSFKKWLIFVPLAFCKTGL